MNYQALGFWFGVAQWLVTIATVLYVWLSNRQKATQSQIKELDKKVDGHEERLTRVEERMPDAKEVTKLSIQLAGIDGDIKSLREEIRGVRGSLKPFTEAVTRIEGYLLNGGRK